MSVGKTDEPERSFVKFVREMSEATSRLEDYEEDPEKVMSEAGLSEEEKEIIRGGDEAAILAELEGTSGEVASIIPIRPLRVRFRRRRPPKPTTTTAD